MYNETERIMYARDVEEGIYRENAVDRVIQEQKEHETQRDKQEFNDLKRAHLELIQRNREREARESLSQFLKSLNIK